MPPKKKVKTVEPKEDVVKEESETEPKVEDAVEVKTEIGVKAETQAEAEKSLSLVVTVGKYHVPVKVGVDATIADLRVALRSLVLSPDYLLKEYRARELAIMVLACDCSVNLAGEPIPDDKLVSDCPETIELQSGKPIATPEALKAISSLPDLPQYTTGISCSNVVCVGACSPDMYGGISGHCSRCWGRLSAEEKKFHSVEQEKLQTKRDEAMKLVDESAGAAEAARDKVLQEAAAVRATAAAAHVEALKARKEEGKCCKIRNLDRNASLHEYGWYIWGTHEASSHGLEIWSCGLRHSSHVNNPPCPVESWKDMDTLTERLAKNAAAAMESSEGEHPYNAFWISSEFQQEAGVTDVDDVGARLRKVLKIPDSVPYSSENKLSWTRACFWDQAYYYDGRVKTATLTKLKAATNAMKKACKKDSVYRITFCDDQGPNYPVFIAGITSKGDHLLVVYSERTET